MSIGVTKRAKKERSEEGKEGHERKEIGGREKNSY